MQRFVEFSNSRGEAPDTANVLLTARLLEAMDKNGDHTCLLEAMALALQFVHQSLSSKGKCAASTPAITWLVQEFVR